MRVIVVGATGILAPAARALVARGDDVAGIARDASAMPDGVEPISVDAKDPAALLSRLGDRRWDRAIVYAPATSDETLAMLAASVDGAIVQVLTSEAAAPDQPDRLTDNVLILGWHDDPEGVRWHTPLEVSQAALAVLDGVEGRVLGTVRPWEARP